MLTTKSGLRADFDALSREQRSADNLRALIRHNLYFNQTGVSNGQLVLQEPAVQNQELNNVVAQLNCQHVVDNWDTLITASTAVDRTIAPLMDYDNGSCPAFIEQPAMFVQMGDIGRAMA